MKAKIFSALILFALLLVLLSLPALVQNKATEFNKEGISLLKQGKYNESIRALNKALEIKPDYGPAWANKGTAFLILCKYNESLQAYNKAIEINSNDAVAWNGKGNVFYKMDKYEDALKASNRALEIKPKVAGYWYNKSLALKSLHRDAEAEAALAKAKKLHRSLLSLFGITYFFRGS